MDVVDPTAIEDSAFSTSFLVFDQVDISDGYSAAVYVCIIIVVTDSSTCVK